MIKKIVLFLCLSLTIFANGHILIYHRVGDKRHKSTSVTKKKFEDHLRYLKKNNYVVVPLEKMTKAIEMRKDIPNNWVAITIDDGFKSFYINGYPILKKYRYPFTVFVNTLPTDGGYGDYMTWDMLKTIEKDPIGDIQSHSKSHPHFPQLTEEKASKDIKEGKKRLEEKLGKKIESFAYPYGEYDKKTVEILKRSGHKFAFKQVMGAVSKDSNPYMINRIAVGESGNLKFLLRTKYLPAKWIQVKHDKKMLYSVKVQLPKGVDKVQVYLSGHKWHWLDVKNKVIQINETLTRKRNTLLLKDRKNRMTDYQILTY